VFSADVNVFITAFAIYDLGLLPEADAIKLHRERSCSVK